MRVEGRALSELLVEKPLAGETTEHHFKRNDSFVLPPILLKHELEREIQSKIHVE
jgi:hypothetical protein